MQGGADDLFSAVDDGATPLDPDECAGLIPSWVATRSDLNLAEQANIEKGLRWASHRRGDMLDEAMVFELPTHVQRGLALGRPASPKRTQHWRGATRASAAVASAAR